MLPYMMKEVLTRSLFIGSFTLAFAMAEPEGGDAAAVAVGEVVEAVADTPVQEGGETEGAAAPADARGDEEAAEDPDEVPPVLIGGGDTEVVQALLASGASVHAKDANGCSLLHEAAMCNNADAVRILLDAGADVRDTDNSGNTPLHMAARNGALNVVPLLLEAEANINAVNKAGDTPLMLAIRARNGEMVRLLLACGADASLGNYSDESPLALAYSLGWEEGVQLLQEASPKR